ncbi:hypothetical protein [Trichlorobacter lovleyi]|uniref:hypothetical protein n=1 Tax=Trichlorobacter lovleyi TaxID=313985 RepID=UPI003D0F5B4D
MAKTSIHIVPVKPGSEAHNRREKELDYVRKEFSHLNESWEVDSIENRLTDIRARYTATTGQRMQGKATPIREGVAVIGKDTTMEQLRVFAERLEARFGIKTFQIHIHRDEGHTAGAGKDWKPNLHAHLLFDWTDTQGKSIKLNRQDTAEVQTILADCLGMERGKSSDKKHLTALQYKTAAEEGKAKALRDEIGHLSVKKTFIDIVEGLFHPNEKKRLKNEILGLKNENAELLHKMEGLRLDNARLSSEVVELNTRISRLSDRLESSRREFAMEGERRAVKLINNLLQKHGLPQIDYRAYGDGYENAVYLKNPNGRTRGLDL